MYAWQFATAPAIGVIPWSPLARGRLTRDWRETSDREETDEVGKKLYTAAVEAIVRSSMRWLHSRCA